MTMLGILEVVLIALGGEGIQIDRLLFVEDREDYANLKKLFFNFVLYIKTQHFFEFVGDSRRRIFFCHSKHRLQFHPSYS
jgi:hypothetical protein